MAAERKQDLFGVVLGAIVFLVGIGILVATFFRASALFATPASELIKSENPDLAKIGADFATVVLQIGVLLVMSIVGSVISSKGVRMYWAARSGGPEKIADEKL